jgi:hypothetical protein
MRAMSWYAQAVHACSLRDTGAQAAPFRDPRTDLSVEVYADPPRRVRFEDLVLSSHARNFVLYDKPVDPALLLRALVRTLRQEKADVFSLLAARGSCLSGWTTYMHDFIKHEFSAQAVVRAAETLGLRQVPTARKNLRRRRARRKLELARWTRLFTLCKGMTVAVGKQRLELLGDMKFSPPAKVTAQFAGLGVHVVRLVARDLGRLELSLSPGTATMLTCKLGSTDLVRLVLEFRGL